MPLETAHQIPLPPMEFRRLVGPLDPARYDNPTGEWVYSFIEAKYYRNFLDFGCGCGRIARQLAQQNTPPEKYVGIDLHGGMIQWCQQNITPFAPQFEFHHHDVYNIGLNPASQNGKVQPFPVHDHQFTLINAISVFTHLEEESAVFYLKEVARVLAEDGVFHGTFFVFDKSDFPMMQEFQNALYINLIDPTNAVIFDKTWLKNQFRANGLKLIQARLPKLHGGQWNLVVAPLSHTADEVDFAEDDRPVGKIYPLPEPSH